MRTEITALVAELAALEDALATYRALLADHADALPDGFAARLPAFEALADRLADRLADLCATDEAARWERIGALFEHGPTGERGDPAGTWAVAR